MQFLLLLLLPVSFVTLVDVQDFYYYPDHVVYDTPNRSGMAYEEVSFKSVDGTKLSGWFIPAVGVAKPSEAKGTIVHMHGNAHNMTSHWKFLEWLPREKFNLLMFNYRGYGKSEGKPSHEGVFEDAVSALDYLRSRSDVDSSRLFLFGQSLGGTIAISVASESPEGIKAVAVESPFYSHSEIANYHALPGAGIFINDRWSAKQFVARLSPVPLLLIHGTADFIVPYKHSTMLLEEAGQPKQLVSIEGGRHMGAFMPHNGTKYRGLLTGFFEKAAHH